MPRFGVFALASRHGPGFRMPFERRPFDKLVYVSAGAGALDRGDGAAVPLAEGDFLAVPAGLVHRFRDRPRAPMTLNVVCVDRGRWGAGTAAEAALRDLLRRAGRGRPRPLRDAYRRGQVLGRMRAMVFEQTRRAPLFGLALRVQAQDLVLTALRALGDRPLRRAGETAAALRLRGTLAWLANHFREPVRIPALARMAGMSYRSYTAHFRRITGATVSAHLAGLRVAYARERLAAGSSIVDAALDAGFGDLSHFYRVFRRRYGLTPGRARRSGARPGKNALYSPPC